MDDQRKMNTDFIVECHGLFQSATNISQSSVVSTHWIRSSLDVCIKTFLSLLFIGQHALFIS